jgi:hypothetical protein
MTTPLCYAFEIQGKIGAIPMALWAADYIPGERNAKYQLHLRPIAGGYVALYRVGAGKQCLPPAPEDLRYGRTDKYGWIVLGDGNRPGDPQELPPPPTPRPTPPLSCIFGESDPVVMAADAQEAAEHYAYALPGEAYRIFWTYRYDLFLEFVKLAREAREAPGAAFDLRNVHAVEVFPYEPLKPVPAIAGLTQDEVLRALEVLLPGAYRGYHAGFKVAGGCTPAIFDVTPETLRSLYFCEWLQWCAISLLREDKDWPALLRMVSVIQAAQSMAPFPDLRRELPGGGEMGACADALIEYVLELAVAKDVRRATVRRALTFRVSNDDWRDAARELERKTNAVHPATKGVPFSRFACFGERHTTALIAHYDLYNAAFLSVRDLAPLQAHMDHIERVKGWVLEKQQSVLRSIDLLSFKSDLGLHLPETHAEKRQWLLTRLLDACATHERAFWEEKSPPVTAQTQNTFDAKALKWLGADAEATGKTLLTFLQSRLGQYKFTAQSVDALVERMYALQCLMLGRQQSGTLPVRDCTVHLKRADATGQALVAYVQLGQEQHTLGLYRIASQEAGRKSDGPNNATAKPSKEKLVRLTHWTEADDFHLVTRKATVRYFEGGTTLADNMLGIAAVLKASVALDAMLSELSATSAGGTGAANPVVFLDLGEEVFQGFAPATKLTYYVLNKAGLAAPLAAESKLLAAGEKLGKLGGAVAALHSVYSGFSTLVSLRDPLREDTDAARYLRHEEAVPFWLETVKGVAQVATGVGGVTELLLGLGVTTATAPVAMVTAFGAALIAALDVAIWVESGGERPTQEFEDRYEKAVRRQFKVSAKREIALPSSAESPLPTSPGQASTKETSASRFAKNFAVLNALARTQLKTRHTSRA